MKGDTFTEAEYLTDPKYVAEHATRHGRAVVVRPDGSARVVISVPAADARTDLSPPSPPSPAHPGALARMRKALWLGRRGWLLRRLARRG